MPKIIIFDLDGTLTESKQAMTKEMGEALKKLLDKITVAVMSGADFPQFEKQFLPYLPKDANRHNLFLFPTSASECLTYKNNKWEVIYDYLFTETEKGKIFMALDKVLEETGLVDDLPSYGERIEDRGEQITFSALGQDAPLEVKEKWDPDQKKRHIIRVELQKMIPEFEITIGGTTSIDITHKNITKEDGIIWLSKRFELDPGQMLYVGDALFEGGNDAEVFKTSVQTKQISGPAETVKIIKEILWKQ